MLGRAGALHLKPRRGGASGRSWERGGELAVPSTEREREGGGGWMEEEDADRRARPVSG